MEYNNIPPYKKVKKRETGYKEGNNLNNNQPMFIAHPNDPIRIQTFKSRHPKNPIHPPKKKKNS